MADAPAPPPGGGGPSKPPRPRNNNWGQRKRPPMRQRRHNKNKKGASSAPQIPHLKVTVRHIGDAERHETVEGVLNMIEKLIQQTNQDIKSSQQISTTSSDKLVQLPIQLDKDSIQALVDAERKAIAKAAADAAKEEADGAENADGNSNGTDGTETREEQSSGPSAAETAGSSDVAKVEEAEKDYVGAVKQDSTGPGGPVITACVLYAAPPKKSRRRGEKSGCAYLVLKAPEPPEVSAAAAKDAQKESADDANPSPVATISPVERARITALARLQLLTSIEFLSACAKEDTKSNQLYAGCMVEQAMSAKTWKDKNQRFDNRVGSIESTEDFKRFMTQRTKEEEERMSRPKPMPGGGSMTLSEDAAQNGSGQPVAALVMHIRNRREIQTRLKKSRAKSKKGESNKEKGSTRKTKSTDSKPLSKKGRRKKGVKENKKSGGAKSRAPKPMAMSVLSKSGG